MKKRFLLILTCVIFLYCAAAETLHTHQLSFPNQHKAHYVPFTQAFPQVTFQTDESIWHERTNDLINTLVSAKPPYDLFGINDYLDTRQVMDAGLCVDLSGSDVIRQAVSRMWLPIQAQVINDEKILAVPEVISLSAFGCCEDAWTAAGLTSTTPPSSYEELLDFLEMWLARIKKTPEPGIRVNSMFETSLYNRQSYLISFIPVLLDCYVLPHLYENRIPRFDTPEFRGLLERTVRIAHELYEAEPPPSEGNLQLFDNGLQGFGMIGIKDGYSHAMPLRISTDQPIIFKASLQVLCVGINSPQKQLAIAYLEHVVSHLQPHSATYAYMDSQPLERKNLGIDISDQNQRINKTISQLSDQGLSTETRQELEEQLIRQNQVLTSMQSEEWKYQISPQWLSEYKAIAPHLYFPSSGHLVMSSSEGRNLMLLSRSFTEEEIDMEEYIKRLDMLGK